MDDALINRIVEFEAGTLTQMEIAGLIISLSTTHDLWALKGIHGKNACITMMLVKESENECS